MERKYRGKKACVQDLINNVKKEQTAIESKSRDIHSRAAKMVEEGKENMSKGIKAVAAKIPVFEREIAAKAKDISRRADIMVAEGNKAMQAGIQAVQNGITDQVKENSDAMKEMSKNIKLFDNKVERYSAHIRSHSKEMAHYVHVFYYGEEKP